MTQHEPLRANPYFARALQASSLSNLGPTSLPPTSSFPSSTATLCSNHALVAPLASAFSEPALHSLALHRLSRSSPVTAK